MQGWSTKGYPVLPLDRPLESVSLTAFLPPAPRTLRRVPGNKTFFLKSQLECGFVTFTCYQGTWKIVARKSKFLWMPQVMYNILGQPI